jgi:hypothetical protein
MKAGSSFAQRAAYRLFNKVPQSELFKVPLCGPLHLHSRAQLICRLRCAFDVPVKEIRLSILEVPPQDVSKRLYQYPGPLHVHTRAKKLQN